jgi:hypothetical protein
MVARLIKVVAHSPHGMGKLNLTIDDKLEDKVREAAAKKFGLKKGALHKAVQEAFTLWLDDPMGAASVDK